MRRLILFLTFVGTLLGSTISPAHAASNPPVLAIYFPWFDQATWASGKSADLPAELYNSDDPAAIRRQIAQAQNAGIDGFEVNWWGPGNRTDDNLQRLLAAARGTSFKITAYVDMNGPAFTSPAAVASALAYLQHYFSDPAWFQFQGKPFVSSYGVAKFDVNAWSSILNQVDPGRQAFWMGEGVDMSFLKVFDGMHGFSFAWASDPASAVASYAAKVRQQPGKTYMATVMPGYDDTRLGRGSAGFAVDRQTGAYYTSSWKAAIATQPAIISITSWNEWLEGSQIEPSRGYGDLYLTLTKQLSDSYRLAMGGQPSTGSDSAFYAQAGGGKGGYTISNAGGMGFYAAFQQLGGVDALGYPASRRFSRDGFTYQALQGAILQWRPDQNAAVLANTFEWFTDAGKDDQLLATRGLPLPIRDDGSGGDFQKAKAVRLSWLTDGPIRDTFLAAGSSDRAIQLYGLPMSQPEKHGPFIVQRFQRIAFQHWTDAVPGMPAPGSVVRVLGGDLAKEVGLVPAAAAQPEPAA